MIRNTDEKLKCLDELLAFRRGFELNILEHLNILKKHSLVDQNGNNCPSGN